MIKNETEREEGREIQRKKERHAGREKIDRQRMRKKRKIERKKEERKGKKDLDGKMQIKSCSGFKLNQLEIMIFMCYMSYTYIL